jgi:hypothetical protein
MLEIKGKIIAVLPEETGQSAKGEWKKQVAILEYGDKYPKKVPFEMWKDKIVALSVGDEVTLVFDIDAREWNGKWFTSVQAFKVVVAGGVPIPDSAPVSVKLVPIPEPEANESGLPF